jgi:hypothetical protein
VSIIPEPTDQYQSRLMQRQLREGLDTLKNELNFGYQEDLKDEQARLEWFFS